MNTEFLELCLKQKKPRFIALLYQNNSLFGAGKHHFDAVRHNFATAIPMFSRVIATL